eukprot:GHVU01083207.1.p1 GENE.GHVU01083207.1~~GHVU01083207.1.p1  ORF type:complete len:105 (+),score=2.58 GHVU01083207.1:950-1264(+)
MSKSYSTIRDSLREDFKNTFTNSNENLPTYLFAGSIDKFVEVDFYIETMKQGWRNFETLRVWPVPGVTHTLLAFHKKGTRISGNVHTHSPNLLTPFRCKCFNHR